MSAAPSKRKTTHLKRTNSLAILFPDIVKDWHPIKNGTLTLEQVTVGSGKKVWWKCNQGPDHEWQASVYNRTGKKPTGCPFCGKFFIVLGKKWEITFYKFAPILLTYLIWKSGHGKNRIFTPKTPEKQYIKPEIIIYYHPSRIIKKFIEAKLSETAIEWKDTEIYPRYTHLKLVEFWLLSGTSRVELHYPDGTNEIRSLIEFNEDNVDPTHVDKILVYKDSNYLISKLKQQITNSNKEQIENLIKQIYQLQKTLSGQKNIYTPKLSKYLYLNRHN